MAGRLLPAGGNMPSGPAVSSEGVETMRETMSKNPSSQPATSSTMRAGLQLGPPGRWWDDKHFAKTLHLRPEQKKRMDEIFDENRTTLVSHNQALQQEESKLEGLSRAQTLEESTLFAQIDRVAQARAELEKAYTHLMLQVRKEMDADQIARLDASR
jgi:Spy/CpxP family protein refolding chaperone